MSVRDPRRWPRSLLALGAGCFALCCLVPTSARAGGVARPNSVGARAVGMGGAYTAVADDALSIWHNPAGLARIRTADLYFGAELVFPVGGYDPPDRADPANPGQLIKTPVERPAFSGIPVPAVMGGTRFLVGQNSYLAVGLGFYHSYGGGTSYDKNKITTEGLVKNTTALLELAPALAYQVSERIFIGATLRIGVGLFSALQSCAEILNCSHDPPGLPLHDTRVATMTGAGAGYSLGIQVLPAPWFGLGLTYRSNLDVTTSGRNVVRTSIGTRFDAQVTLPFPQSLTAGFFARLHRRVLLAGQLGWVDNSTFREIFLDVEGWTYSTDALKLPLRMKDSFQGHLGLEIDAHRHLVLRAGMAYDSPAIPPRYLTRSLLDTHKLAWDLGLTLRFGAWRVELAVEALMGDVKTGFAPRVVAEGTTSEARYLPGGTISMHLGGGVAW